MPVVRLLAIASVFLLPSTAWAQPWADAYKAGDYKRTADLLHPIVAAADFQLTSDDPAPARHLAILYARGLGVDRDPIAACALAHTAEMAAQMSAPRYANTILDYLDYQAMIAESERFVREHCEQLSLDDRMLATSSRGCYAFGMPEQVLTLGRQTVRIGRLGIGLQDAGSEKAIPLFCPFIVARIRATSIDPPADAAPGVVPRHFLELLSWQTSSDPGHRALAYVLRWDVYEVHDGRMEIVVQDQLATMPSWPRPTLPADLDTRLMLEMIRSGHVRWRMDGAPPRRGWIMLPEKDSR